MIARPIAEYLVRFGAADHTDDAVDDAYGEAAFACDPDQGPDEDNGFSRQLALNEGWDEGFAAACREQAAERAGEKLAFEARLAAERVNWVQEEGGKLTKKLDAALAEIEVNIADSVARILGRFLIEPLRRKAVAALAEDIGLMLSGRDHSILEISGAEDLVAALCENRSELSSALNRAPNQSIDVRVISDQTIIELRIEAWMDRIEASVQ